MPAKSARIWVDADGGAPRVRQRVEVPEPARLVVADRDVCAPVARSRPPVRERPASDQLADRAGAGR